VVVPVIIVFELLLRPVGSLTSPNNASRLDLAQTARSEYDAIIARLRIARGVKPRMSAAANKAVQTRDIVSVYRDRERRFVGAFAVTAVNGKQVFLSVTNSAVLLVPLMSLLCDMRFCLTHLLFVVMSHCCRARSC
jgi:hypothetical protein